MKTHLLYLTARVCLAAQLTGILTGTLVPVVSLAKGTGPAHTLTASRTVPHTLGEGETVTAVAAQYGLTVAELKKLNQLRTFSKPFDRLSAGDEIDVPVMKAGPEREPATAAQDDPAAFWAGTASTAGQMLQLGDTTRAAAGMAGSMTAGAASAGVQHWLSRAGTARVNLAVDSAFSFSDASADYLLPLYDTPDWLAFTQLGYRHKDERHSVNLGAGVRTFRSGWMYGMNAFLDNDLTGHNRRLGLGGEAWIDYLRLSANGYRGLTGWHQSRDVADHDERPATGFDVRMEGWVPAYPQLGGKLTYEQYQGGEVALLGKDERQKNPKAVTAGGSYTPVPLVTLGAEHRQSQGGHSDARFSVGVSYRPGVPWADQVDPAAVSLSRTLAAGRYDLVERNNSIVLEYKKQTLIRLSLPETLAGKAGNTDTLTATVTSRYGVSGIDWEYGEVLAAGGRVSEVNKNSLQITYPPYQAVRGAESNVYRISAVARDGQGNVSERRTTTITVQEPEAAIAGGDLTVSSLKSDKDIQTSGNASAIEVTATVKDKNGNPVPDVRITFTTTGSASITGTPVTDSNGQAKVRVTNPEQEDITVTAKSATNPLDSGLTRELTFLAGTPVPMPDSTKILAYGHHFGVKEGFPTTGFAGGTFQFATEGDIANNNKYLWSVSSGGAWVSVDDEGRVHFKGVGDSSVVSVLATPKGGGTPLSYTFRLSRWFVPQEVYSGWSDASSACSNQGGLPASHELSKGEHLRQVGALWGEWGRMSPDGGQGFFWATETDSSGRHRLVGEARGTVYTGVPEGGTAKRVCRKNL